MTRIYLFADEAGNFDFSHGKGASRYFVLTTVTLLDCTIGDELLALRRQLAWEGEELTGDFHATEERQAIRDRVFNVLTKRDFRIDATILDKPRTQPHLRSDESRFYKTAWYLHLKYVAPQIVSSYGELLVIVAAIATKRMRAAFHQAVQDVVIQVAPTSRFQTAFWPATVDPCLQVADYCCWAIQRKWESGDPRSYVCIKDKIQSEFDVFGRSSTMYY